MEGFQYQSPLNVSICLSVLGLPTLQTRDADPLLVLCIFPHKARLSRGRRPRPREQRAWLSERWFYGGSAQRIAG